MTNETFVKMWNILKENDFKIDVAIKSEMICASCKNIMIKPCNVPCGCRYCYDCLISYLNGKEKFCLGQSEYCKNELINIDKNVFTDQAANIKISRIVAKCPLKCCEFTTELGKMADHMRTCNRQLVACPYYTVGCEDNKIDAENLKQHFKQENYCHARLLMDFVNNWRNEMKLLKNNILDLQEENKYTKQQMESNQKMILALEENVSRLLNENRSLKELDSEKFHQNNQIEEIILAIQMKSEEQNDKIRKNKKKLDEMEINQDNVRTRIERITQENKDLREELEIIKLDNKSKEKIILTLQSKQEEQETGKVKEKCEFIMENQKQMKTRIEELFLENKSLRNELETVKLDKTEQETIYSFQMKAEEQKQAIKRNTEKIENLKQIFDKKCNQIEKNREQMEIRIDKMSQENADKSKQIETKLTQVQINQNCGEFLWCIQNWEDIKERARNGSEIEIYSDPFYSHKNGYKISLSLYPYGDGSGEGTYLSLFICIMLSEFDNILPWPFCHGVKLDLLIQKTGLPHVSENVCYEDSPSNHAWKRPISERNIGIGRPQFIKLSELSSNAALCQSNQIWIKATPQIKP